MPRLSDDVKETREDETLDLFMKHRREASGPSYEFARRQERPDRVIRVVGSVEEIGVEITRCVDGRDAAADRRIVVLAHRIRGELSQWAPGGRVCLYGGDFPGCSKGAVDALVAALRGEISAKGSLAAFLGTLGRGCWRHERTTFHISSAPDDSRWTLTDNHVRSRPGRRVVAAAEMDELLLDRIRDKAAKGAEYGWKGPLILLVRNPYRVHRPSPAVLNAARESLPRVFDEAWLVNHTEGAVDSSPPRPRLVDLIGSK